MKKPIWLFIVLLNVCAWFLVWWALRPTQSNPPNQGDQETAKAVTSEGHHAKVSEQANDPTQAIPINTTSESAEAVTWQVQVQDAQGQALPNARVRLQAAPGDGLIYERACDQQGNTRFTGPDVDTVDISVAAPGYAPGDARLHRDAPQTRVTLTKSQTPPQLSQAQVVTGKVLDETGQPLSDVRVTCSRCLGKRQFNTGNNGRFGFEALFPGAVLRFSKKGRRPVKIEGFTSGDTVVLQAYPTFQAQVVDRADNRPIETFGYSLVAEKSSFYAESKLQKHADGLFQVAGVPTDQELTCRIKLPNRYTIEHHIQYEANAATAVHRLWIDSRPGRVSIQVVNEAGDPLPQAMARFHSKGLMFDQMANPLGLIRSQELLMQQRFTIHVTAPGYLRQSLNEREPTPLDSPQDPLVVILERATQVTVIVNQNQYPGVDDLNAADQAGAVYRARRTGNQTFIFSGLPPGAVTLEVMGEKTWHVDANILAQDHQEILLGDQGVTIAGRFFVGSTAKQEGVLVFGREGEPLRNIVCSKDGRFQARHCLPGRYVIGLPHDQNAYFRRLGDQAPFLRSIEVGNQDMLDLDLHVATPLRLKGCLSQSTHLKLTGTTDEGAPYSEILSHNRGTRFLFYGLPPGRYDLFYEAAGPGSDLVLLQQGIALSRDVDLCDPQKKPAPHL